MITIILILFILIAPCGGFIVLYRFVEGLLSTVSTADSIVIFGRWLLCFGAGVAGYMIALWVILLLLNLVLSILKAFFH